MSIIAVPPIVASWRCREKPLVAAAAAACGLASRTLGLRLLEYPDELLATLSGVAGARLLIVTGSKESLPWVDGATYLGRDPRAPSLLVPTTLEPTVPMALYERAMLAKFPNAAPLAVIADSGIVASMIASRPIARATLLRWLQSWDGN